MPQLFSNNAASTLASGISSSAASLTLASGQGALFPNPTQGDYFLLTLIGTTAGAESSWEIVKCTARSTDTLSIVRAQEGTTAGTWATGTKAELRITAATMISPDSPIRLNPTTVTTDFTVPSGYNAASVGPITIAEGITATVSDNATWSIN
jgi:hypothetical protein